MDNKVFEKKIRPILTYIGTIGAILTSIAYIVLMVVFINGFQYQQTKQTVLFAVVNAAVGLIIANLLKFQGITFAKELPENAEIVKEYYSLHTKDKKNRSITFFWTTSLVKDILTKGVSIAGSTLGLIYIVIVASNDWNLLLLAIVNLILFICFGLLSLNKAYDFYNTSYVAYMKDRINESKEERKLQERQKTKENSTPVEVSTEDSNQQRDVDLDTNSGTNILEPEYSNGDISPNN